MQKKIRVLYDYAIFIMQRYGGVSRYYSELYKVLRNNDAVHIEIFTDPGCNSYLASQFDVKIKKCSKIGKKAKLALFGARTVVRVLKADTRKNKYDILHCTWYNAGYIKILRTLLGKRCPKIVVTIHDLIPFIYEGRGLKRIAGRMRKAISVSDGIICVSENTKKDLLKFFPELRGKDIPVVYHGSSMKEEAKTESIFQQEPYVLYVGKRAKYKNFSVFARAVAELSKTENPVRAVCAGGGPFIEEEKNELRGLNCESLFSQVDVNDDELASLYKNAICFVYPSCYEGFGIPILEAFGMKCPVILSNASCFPEIAGEAAMYFETDDHIALAEAIRKLANSGDVRERLIVAGIKKNSQFSWAVSAEKTLNYYYNLLGNKCNVRV